MKVWVMGRLEDVHFAVAAIKGWNAQSRVRVAESAIAQGFRQYARQCISIVTVPEASPQSSPFALDRSPRTFPCRREDFAPTPDVDVKQFGSRQAGSQAERNDPAGGRAGDKVKVSGHRSATKVVFLQTGEERRGEYPTDSTAVDGQNTEPSAIGPRQRYAPFSQRAEGALQGLVSAVHLCVPLSVAGCRPPPVHSPVANQPS